MKRSHAIRDHEEGACASRALAHMATGQERDRLMQQADQEEDLAAAARRGTYPEELED